LVEATSVEPCFVEYSPSSFFAILLAALTGCDSTRYTYHYVPGKTALLRDGYAVPPPDAPPVVAQAIAAGNRIAGLPIAGRRPWGLGRYGI